MLTISEATINTSFCPVLLPVPSAILTDKNLQVSITRGEDRTVKEIRRCSDGCSVFKAGVDADKQIFLVELPVSLDE